MDNLDKFEQFTRFYISTSGVKVDIGNGVLNFRNGESIESIALDVGRDKTKVSLVRTYKKDFPVTIFELTGYTFHQVAVAIKDFIQIFKPSTVYLSKVGYDLALRDSLIPILNDRGIDISENGTVTYNTK